MKTDELIDLLARGAGAAPTMRVAPRLGAIVALGLLASAAAALGWLGGVPREMYAMPAPWIKFAYAAALALPASMLVARLARPVAQTRHPGRALALVALTMVALGFASLLALPAGERAGALFGQSWLRCPLHVLLLALPTLAGSLWLLRGCAPTHLRAAGFAAGALAGTVGAAGYALSCLETSPAFVGAWYTVGIALAAALGAWLGPRVLRW